MKHEKVKSLETEKACIEQRRIKSGNCAVCNGRFRKLLVLNSTVGNRAARSLIQTAISKSDDYHVRKVKKARDENISVKFSTQVDSGIPKNTPAWSRDGVINIGLASLVMSPSEWSKMLIHESIHSLQQKVAPQSELASSREHAEQLAKTGAENSADIRYKDFLRPAPSLLCYPAKDPAPWNHIEVGRDGLIFEVSDAGVSVRIIKSYKTLGLKENIIENIWCGKIKAPSIGRRFLIKMKSVAKKAGHFNQYFPTSDINNRITLVIITGSESCSGEALGGKVIRLAVQDFHAANYKDTVAHEASHAIIREGLSIDPFALQFEYLYYKLAGTKKVTIPTRIFDPNNPPSLHENLSGEAAGLVMVMDTLWSGSGGHPWHGAHELFASAFAASVQRPVMIRQIIRYYEQADSAIGPLAEELLELVSAAKKPELLGKFTKPDEAEVVKASKLAGKYKEPRLAGLGSPPDFGTYGGVIGWLVKPSTMPQPICKVERKVIKPEELLEFEE